MRWQLDDSSRLNNSGANSNRNSQPDSHNQQRMSLTTIQANDRPRSLPPFAHLQEIVNAVGGSISGIQSSPLLGHLMHTAATTSLPQGNLGHNQPPSTGHHSPSIQAHGNAQIVHPMQSNSQGHHRQILKIEEALTYLDQVKREFENESWIYQDFLCVFQEFKKGRIDMTGVILCVSNLFRGHPDLIEGFKAFYPPGYRIEVQPNEQPPPSS